MTPKQAAFVAEYVKTGNATRSAIAAGYSEATAMQAGSRLLRHVEVSQALVEVDTRANKRVQTKRSLDEAAGSVAWIIAEAVRAVEETEYAPHRVPALALLAKRHPEFRDQVVDQSQHLHLPEGTTLDDLKALRDGLQA